MYDFDVRINGGKRKMYCGRVTFGASGAPTAVGAPGVTVTKAATGQYDFTLPKGFPLLVSAVFQMDDHADVDLTAKLSVSDSDVTAGVVAANIRRTVVNDGTVTGGNLLADTSLDAGALTEPASGRQLSFMLIVADTSA